MQVRLLFIAILYRKQQEIASFFKNILENVNIEGRKLVFPFWNPKFPPYKYLA